MDKNSHHIIQQQKIELSFRDRAEGMGLPNQISALCKERLLPLLEIEMDAVDVPGFHLSLDNVLLDLGVISSRHWEREFVEKSVMKFKEVLRESLADARRMLDEKNQDGSTWIRADRILLDDFLGFLATGNLAARELRSFESILQTLFKTKLPEQNSVQIIRQLNTDRYSLDRLMRQFSGSFVEQLLENLETDSPSVTFSVGPAAFQKRMEVLLRFEYLAKRKLGDVDFSAPLLLIEKEVDLLSEELKKIVQRVLPDLKKNKLPNEEVPEFKGSYILNAGLVLLHPFLPALFRVFSLLDAGGNWKSPEDQAHALFLSQYLITSDEALAENEIQLNKILLGYHLEEPVDRLWKIRTEEKDEIQKLLEAVIRHWSALKNTSVEVLRQSFLQRAGKLQKTENGWLLQVEQKTIDVLIGRLPWAISMIKNQWMEERLLTEWV